MLCQPAFKLGYFSTHLASPLLSICIVHRFLCLLRLVKVKTFLQRSHSTLTSFVIFSISADGAVSTGNFHSCLLFKIYWDVSIFYNMCVFNLVFKRKQYGQLLQVFARNDLCFYPGYYFIKLYSGDFKVASKGPPETFMVASALKCVPGTSTCAPETIDLRIEICESLLKICKGRSNVLTRPCRIARPSRSLFVFALTDQEREGSNWLLRGCIFGGQKALVSLNADI